MNSNPNIPVIIKHIESVFDDDITSNVCIQGLMYHGNEIECGEPAKYSGKMYEMLDDEGNVWWDTLVDDLNKTLHFNSVKNKYIGYIRCKYRLMNLDDDDYDDELYSIEYILKLSIKKIPTNFNIDNEFSDFDELKKLTGIKVHIKDIKPLRDFITDDNNGVNPFSSSSAISPDEDDSEYDDYEGYNDLDSYDDRNLNTKKIDSGLGDDIGAAVSRLLGRELSEEELNSLNIDDLLNVLSNPDEEDTEDDSSTDVYVDITGKNDDIVVKSNPTDETSDPLEDPETLNDLIERLKSQGKLTVTEKKRSKPITKEQWLKRAKYESDLFVKEFDLYNELTEDDWFYVLENIPALIYKYQELDIDFFDIDYLIYKLPGIRMFID